jgi:hypothetical protein
MKFLKLFEGFLNESDRITELKALIKTKEERAESLQNHYRRFPSQEATGREAGKVRGEVAELKKELEALEFPTHQEIKLDRYKEVQVKLLPNWKFEHSNDWSEPASKGSFTIDKDQYSFETKDTGNVDNNVKDEDNRAQPIFKATVFKNGKEAFTMNYIEHSMMWAESGIAGVLGEYLRKEGLILKNKK